MHECAINAAELARRMGVSRERVRQFIAGGRLAVTRQGRRVLIDDSEALAFMERHAVGADVSRWPDPISQYFAQHPEAASR